MQKFDEEKWKIDYWSIFFSILSLILADLALLIPQQRLLIASFSIIAIIFALISFYITKINNNEKFIKMLGINFKEFSNEFKEKLNYLKEIYDLKLRIQMLEKKIKNNKKGQFNLLNLIRILVAIILIYVIIEVIKSLFLK